MRMTLRVALMVLVAGAAAGCASTPLTPMQKRQLTTRLVRTEFEHAFRATLSVLQDEGYAIRETDYEAGFVSAHFTPRFSPEHALEMSVVVAQVSGTRSEIRVTLVHAPDKDDRGWLAKLFRGGDDPEVTDREVFERLFRQIDMEVERRRVVRMRDGPDPQGARAAGTAG